MENNQENQEQSYSQSIVPVAPEGFREFADIKTTRHLYRDLTPEEVLEAKDDIVKYSTEQQELERDLKYQQDNFKAQINRTKRNIVNKVDFLKEGKKGEDMPVWGVADFANNVMNFFDYNGIYVDSRTLTDEERQLRIL